MKRLVLFFSCFSILYLFCFCNKKDNSTTSKIEIEKNVYYLKESIEWNNKATSIINRSSSFYFQSGEIDSVKMYLDKAIVSASNVDTIVLNLVKDGYGNIYHFKYIEGMKLELEGLEKQDNEKTIRGQEMVDFFIDWVERKEL